MRYCIGAHVEEEKITPFQFFPYINYAINSPLTETSLSLSDCENLYSEPPPPLDGRWWIPVHRGRAAFLSRTKPTLASWTSTPAYELSC